MIQNDDLFEVCQVGEHTRKQWIRISKSTRASHSWIRIYESTVSRVFSPNLTKYILHSQDETPPYHTWRAYMQSCIIF